MSTSTKPSRTTQQADDQKLIDGLTKHASSLASLTIAGTPYSTTAFIAALEARIAAAKTTLATRATWQSAVKAELDERAKTKTLVSGLRQTLQLVFAGSIDTLADFGLRPRKPRTPLTPEQKAAAVAKATATRAARHTMGTKQKAKVRGAVPATAPVTAPPAAPAPTVPATPSPQPKP
jgi:hypothetical protein